MKLSINARKLYPEAIFYINWARNSKNRKTKRRLVIKALKEIKCLSKSELRRRIFKKN